MIEENGLAGILSCHVLDLDVIPLDSDVLSMCYKQFYLDYHLHGVCTPIPWVVNALLKLTKLFGPFPSVRPTRHLSVSLPLILSPVLPGHCVW